MVISSVEPDRDTYRLYIPFHYPSNSGSSYAVAVSTEFGKNVVSAYTLFIRLIIAETWAIFIIIGLRMSVRSLRDTEHHKPPSHNTAVISVGILNANGLKDIAMLSLSYLWKLRSEATTRLKLVFWLAVVVIGLLADWGLPIVAAPHLVLGQAAPPNEARIFSPNVSDIVDTQSAIDYAQLVTPAALRAVGSTQVANATIRDEINVGVKEILEDLGNGESILRINYSYHITSQDFGLQGLPDLQLTVEGSCQSSYQYHVQSSVINGIDTDTYIIPNQGSTYYNQSQNVSTTVDGNRPMAYFYNIDPPPGTQSNFSYLLLLSTVGRKSVSQGTDDPFYLTNNFTTVFPYYTQPAYVVLPGRPVLSCWQVDLVINQGISYSYDDLQNSPTSVPNTIALILLNTLPGKLLKIGDILGPSSLASAADSSVGPFFDAASADIRADLSRLILSTYISSTNLFTDLTTFSIPNPNTSTISNLFLPQNLTDASRFVLFSTAVTALSIPMLIAVPVVMVIWIGILFILKHCFQSHWAHVKAMSAQVLFRCLDVEMRKNAPEVPGVSHKFKQDGDSCFEGNPIDQSVCIVPRHEGDDLFWVHYHSQQPSEMVIPKA